MCAAISGAVIGVGVAGYQIYEGAQEKKRAKADMNEYERADLENAFENMQVSTLGTEIMRDELARSTASTVDALQQGGSRMVTAGLPHVQNYITQGANQMRSDLDNQMIQRERLIASDNANMRGIKENRDLQNLNAISSQYQSGNQNMWNGILGVASSTMSVGRAIQNDSENINANQDAIDNGITQSSQVQKIPNTQYITNDIGNTMFDPNFGNIGNEFVNKKIFG